MTHIARLQRMNHGSHFRAFTLRGGQPATSIDPFLAVDHAWTSGPTFPPHPHAGFSAVSYLFLDSETGIDNRDSLGNRNLIQPGGLHWTAAGTGVVHEEVPTETGKTVHMLQVFINLPLHLQGGAPFVFSLEAEDVPVVQLPGVKVRVPLGRFADIHSPLSLPTEVSLLDISLEPGAQVTVPIAAGHGAFVMPIDGELSVDGQPFDLMHARLPVSLPQPEERQLSLRADQGPAKAVLFSGRPLGQPVYWQGPLALASQEALAAAVEAYQRGAFGTLQAR
ncbi:pirin family protein [Pseudomonas chlororaphis]|uniref:pirin family protein n=1 Tax=Pseudomonas chlororaphis TaxID=587753 RepID=UPI002366107B|nr:pirin-like C-terminal cupin domain-containing protein [Pseudomonas chlororaphis]WDH20906.1 pirin-like C-terminal cupin domain-containing protein [Pseudomonas chlororaphis]